MTTNHHAGHAAEQRAARYLQSKGFKLIEINWHTKLVEVDIIAEKAGRLYFIEIKYRRNLDQGNGFDYITSKKIQRMKLGAEMWLSKNYWPGEVTLAALSANSDDNFEILELT